LRKQKDFFSELHGRFSATEPNRVEIIACAANVHAMYSGMENIFKRILIHFDEKIIRDDSWHMNLLK